MLRQTMISVLLALGLWSLLFSQNAAETKVASYAPAKDAEAELNDYLEKIGKDLQSQEDYESSNKKRVALDASTIAVLALSLGMHEEDNRFKSKATAIIEASGELVEASDDFGDATEAFATLKSAAAKEPHEKSTLTWSPTADLGLLMQQVPIVNNSLRRGVSSRRFKRSIEKSAGHAVTLAAIAQASMLDTSYCGDEADEKEWRKICADMRDACAEVYAALKSEDQDKAKAGNEKIVKTCDACHHRFRD